MNLRKMIAAWMSMTLTCSSVTAANHVFRLYPAAAEIQTAAAAGYEENPCNRQDDREVPYDGSRWVQPVAWNVPTVNPRNYKGSIMLFFDKISLDAEYTRGKTQRVYFSVWSAAEPVSMMKFHVFYDTRLTVKQNDKGEFMNTGKAIKDFTTGSAMIEEGQLAFYAYSDSDVVLERGSVFTIDFIIPENAEPGDVYPIGISYVDDGIVCDTFINSAQDEAGRLLMTYVFTKGISNGYLRMNGEKKTTAPTAAETGTVTTATTAVTSEPLRGDPTLDQEVSVEDAQLTLKAYTNRIAGNDMGLTGVQIRAADVDSSGEISVEDVQLILRYYTENTVAGKTVTWDDLIPPQ